MIRQSSLLLLLACASVSFAQPLYKWAETDGSITFSPNPPPAGKPFETIEQATSAPAESPTAVFPKAAAANAATNQAISAPRISGAGGSTRAESIAASKRSIEEPGRMIVPADVQPAAQINLNSREIANTRRVASIAASNKQSRCQDLQKRVVSLERRLKSRLTPEDMDNTVIHMARYQRSFDQHCEQ